MCVCVPPCSLTYQQGTLYSMLRLVHKSLHCGLPKECIVIAITVGWRPSLLGWRPSLVGWRPSLVGWRPSPLGWRPSPVKSFSISLYGYVYILFGHRALTDHLSPSSSRWRRLCLLRASFASSCLGLPFADKKLAQGNLEPSNYTVKQVQNRFVLLHHNDLAFIACPTTIALDMTS